MTLLSTEIKTLYGTSLIEYLGSERSSQGPSHNKRKTNIRHQTCSFMSDVSYVVRLVASRDVASCALPRLVFRYVVSLCPSCVWCREDERCPPHFSTEPREDGGRGTARGRQGCALCPSALIWKGDCALAAEPCRLWSFSPRVRA